jgi:glycosyltransferase involved in cell wall biosynthesis
MKPGPSKAPVAVVIPAFNAGDTLAVCLNSVLAQSLPPREVIVVDDGSMDATVEVAREFSPPVRLLQQENQGSAVARQLGTMSASSAYIAYLDADDWWPEHTLARYTDLIESTDIHFLMADFVRALPGAQAKDHLPRNTSFFPWFREFLRKYGKPEGPDLFKLTSSRGLEALLRGYPYFPSASLARRQAILDVGGWDRRFRRCQDFDVALRLARRFPIHFLDSVQAIVGINEGNRDADAYVSRQTAGDIRVLEAHYGDNPQDPNYRRQVARAVGRKYYHLGNVCGRTGDRRSALAAYRSALKWPGRRAKAAARMLLLLARLNDGKIHAHGR